MKRKKCGVCRVKPRFKGPHGQSNVKHRRGADEVGERLGIEKVGGVEKESK